MSSVAPIKVPAAVPFVALDRQHAALRPDLERAFARVLSSGEFVLGPHVDRFEQAFAAHCGVAHCVGVGSGTAALALTLRAAGIGPGDEVIVPAHTFIASAFAVVHAGAIPVLCDVDDATGLIDPVSAEAAVGERTAALIAVHLYGQVCDMEVLGRLGAAKGIAVFEDAAQAHGATLRGRRAGSLSLAAGFSFYPSKNLGALGDGGAICTDDDDLAQRARQLRHLGQRVKGRHAMLGFNERLDELQAACLYVKLGRLDAWNARRRAIAGAYREGLPEAWRQVDERPHSVSVHHLFTVRVRDRGATRRRLAERGIETGVHYPRAVHGHPPFEATRRSPTGLGVAEAWAAHGLSLPMHAELRDDEVDRVISACIRTNEELG